MTGHDRRRAKSPDAPVYIPPPRYLRDGEQPLDARSLIGLTEAEATALLERHGCFMRVLQRDGQWLFEEQNDISHRIDVAVTDGIVIGLALHP
jgi:hypothetical protein